jgi:hypothetical protein
MDNRITILGCFFLGLACSLLICKGFEEEQIDYELERTCYQKMYNENLLTNHRQYPKRAERKRDPDGFEHY